jgi:putative spermidine/putrescine transport system ATP-binding protein
MSYLSLTNIQKNFAGNQVIRGIDLAVEQGEFLSFLGPSGCGKTTTLRMIAGFETPSEGNIFLDGINLTQFPPNQRNLGMVFQSYALFPNLNVTQNIAFGLEVRHTPKAQIQERVREMLDLIQLREYGHRFPSQLSGGQQQRVALARALAIHPRVLLLDEPLSALDAKIRLELRQEIRTIQQKLQITTIYVTHDQEEALSLSDRIVVMHDGVIEQIGTPFEIYNYPANAFVASFVGQINLLPVEISDFTRKEVKIGKQLVRVGRMGEAKDSVAQLAIRPEELQLGPASQGNTLTGQVAGVSYLGSVLRCKLQMEDQTISMDMFNSKNLSIPQVGQELSVHFSEEACWLLW